jgi:hypothetical protein
MSREMTDTASTTSPAKMGDNVRARATSAPSLRNPTVSMCSVRSPRTTGIHTSMKPACAASVDKMAAGRPTISSAV